MTDMRFIPLVLRDINLPWEKVLHLGTPVTFPKNTNIDCYQNPQQKLGMYYIRQGRVRLSFLALNGQEKFIFYMGRGTIFNEIPMIIQTPAPGFFTCMEAVEAVFLPQSIMTEGFIRENPDLALNLISSLTTKSSNFHALLCFTGMYDAFTNVCRILYSMHLYNRENSKIVPTLTQQEIASILGIHRSTLHSALTRLNEEGIIGKYSRNVLEIYDLQRLGSYISDGL